MDRHHKEGFRSQSVKNDSINARNSSAKNQYENDGTNKWAQTKQVNPNKKSLNQQNKTRQPPVHQDPLQTSTPSDSAELNFVAPLEKNTTLVSVRSRKTTALYDTGAAISCANTAFVRKALQKDFKLGPSNYRTVVGVGGEHHDVAGTVTLTLNFGGLNVDHIFHVIDDLHHSIILGLDFMEKYRVNIDIGRKLMSIMETKVCQLSTKTGFARSASAFTIEPNHEADINIKLSRCKNGSQILVEPAPQLQKFQIQSAKCVITVLKGKGILRILNPTNKQIHVPENQIIGVITPLESPSIYSLNTDSQGQGALNQQHSDVNTKANDINEEELTFDFENSDLTEEQKCILFAFLKKNRDIFTTGLHNLGRTHLQTYQIDTGDALPIKSAFYRQSPDMRREIERQVKEMLEHNIIEPSNSAWHSPVVLVRKPNNEYRFAVDYRKLNKVTKPQSFPLPRLEDMFDAIGETGAKYFTSADISKAYWQVPLDDDAKEKSAFITHDGIYAWNCMGFGLRNGPATFQSLMSQVLRGINWRYALCYIDDIVIFSPTFEMHLQHLGEVFQRLREAGLKLSPSKCFFAQKKIKFLGHILSKEGIQPDSGKYERVKNLKAPTNPSEVKSVLGLFNFYKKFIKDYSKICAPLFSLLQKDKDFSWTDACDTAFQTLKTALISAPILAYPNMNRPFVLTCDASRSGLGYILGQVGEDNREHVIAYGGRALRKAEKNYHVSELECLALVEGIREYRTYLSAGKFTVYTDHKALQYIHTIKNPHRRLTRWSMEFQEFDYEVQHKKGVNNGNADALSRLPFPSEEVSVVSQSSEQNCCEKNSTQESIYATVEENSEPELLCVQFQFSSPAVAIVEPKPEATSGLNNTTTVKTDTSDLKPPHNPNVKENQDKNPNIQDDKDTDEAQTFGELPISTKQKQCPEISEMYTYIDSGKVPDDPERAKAIVFESELYDIVDGVLYHFQRPRSK